MTLGLILWFIVILLIASCQEGFLLIIAIVGGIPALLFVVGLIYGKYHKDPILPPTPEELLEREKSIDAWEKKWGRKHPSRMK